jgi:predicted O-methyltransferase YrrM
MYTIKKDQSIMRDQHSSEGLLDMIKELGDVSDKNMIEIGSFIGESTIIFAGHFKHVSAIDPFIDNYDPEDMTSNFNFDEVYQEYKNRIEPKKEKVTTYKLTSNDALSVLHGEKFDFIYIDGMHQYENVLEDITNYLPFVKEGGVIGGHDYGGPWKGVQKAVDQVFGKPDKVFKDTSWIKQL